MAELHWFPFFAKDWIASRARALMSHEQRGVYLDLLAIAWDDGSVEPSLPADDASLASMAGLSVARWQKIAPLVRAQFVERDWRLYNAKLSDVWQDQQAKHAAVVKKAQKGGKASGESRRKKGSRASTTGSTRVEPQVQPDLKQSESDTAVQTLTEFVPAVAPDSALGVEPPRASAPDFALGMTLIRTAIESAPNPARERFRANHNAARGVG
jgi:uncharacterized protein YdaU (DUF1376 family)